MPTFESFPDQFTYGEHLQREQQRGRLLVNTVTPETRAQMIGQVLADPEPGTYLEIGHASTPYFVDSTRPFRYEQDETGAPSPDNVRYIGVDGGSSEYKLTGLRGWTQLDSPLGKYNMNQAAMSVAMSPNAAAGCIAWGDAQQLPLANAAPDQPAHEKVRETFMRDVLIIPGVHPRSIERIMAEQARVLDPNGTVVIRETAFAGYHHGMTEGRYHDKYLALHASLQNAGFTRRTEVFDTDREAFPALLEQFPGGNDDDRFANGYYVLAQQGSEGLLPARRSAVSRALGWFGLRSKQG